MIARKGSNFLPEIRYAISLLKPQALSDTTLGLTIRGIICLLTIFPFRTFVKTKFENFRTTNEVIYTEATCPLHPAVKRKMPSANSTKKQAQRARQQADSRPRAPKSLSDIRIQDCLSMMEESMLIHDNMDNDNRIIVFGTQSCVQLLERSNSCGIDGTFDSCPQLFNQLVTIHAKFNSSDLNDSNVWSFPCLWVLLTSKEQSTYDNIMVDFELGLRNALASSFHGTKIDGCFFHFCQALMRHVNDLGLKKRYERVHVNINGIRTYSRTRIWIRRLMSLAFVPPEDVITAFHTVLDAIPEDLDIDAFLNYFQATWIEGMSTVRRNWRARYPPTVWNIRSRTLQMMNRTNNHLEAFHNAFKQKVGHSNPTIWGFITGMRLQQAASDNIMAVIGLNLHCMIFFFPNVSILFLKPHFSNGQKMVLVFSTFSPFYLCSQ